MKNQMIQLCTCAISLFTFYACVDRNDVRSEILSYHECIMICEEKAEEQMQEVRQCEASCDITWREGKSNCRRHPIPDLPTCINQMDENHFNCIESCRQRIPQIKAELKKCKRACIPSVNPK